MILITGATGKTGGAVARALAAAGQPIRCIVRDAGKAAAIEALGAELAVGDIADEAFLASAMKGIDKTFLVMPNEENQVELETRFIDLAKAAGITQLVYLSSLESVPGSTNPITRNHVATEDYLRASGLNWTILRPTFFNQLLMGSAKRIRESGQIVMPAGDGTVAATDVRDVGEVTRVVMTEPGHDRKSYDLTGPELLTLSEIAEKFSAVLGKPVTYVNQPLEDFARILSSVGYKPWRVNAVCQEFTAIAGGAIDHTTDMVEQLLGRPPISLEQFIRDHIAAFR